MTRKPIKTVSDFKKLIVVGASVHTLWHVCFSHRDIQGKVVYKTEDRGIRKVSKAQSNSFALKTEREGKESVDSWCSFPKASEASFTADGQMTIWETDRDGTKQAVLTYSVVD